MLLGMIHRHPLVRTRVTEMFDARILANAATCTEFTKAAEPQPK